VEAVRLQDGNSCLERARFDRRIRNVMASAARAIRLGNGSDDAVARSEQRVERRDGERGRPEEHDAQGAARYHFPVRVSFLIFRTMMSRLMPRSRSTNSVPSR